MTSNALKTGSLLPKPPAVCIGGPKPPYPPLILELFCQPGSITWDEYSVLTLFGDHPARPKGENYTVQWTLTGGYLNPEPPSNNRVEGIGRWYPPEQAGLYRIKCLATWVDGTTAFTECAVIVAPPST